MEESSALITKLLAKTKLKVSARKKPVSVPSRHALMCLCLHSLRFTETSAAWSYCRHKRYALSKLNSQAGVSLVVMRSAFHRHRPPHLYSCLYTICHVYRYTTAGFTKSLPSEQNGLTLKSPHLYLVSTSNVSNCHKSVLCHVTTKKSTSSSWTFQPERAMRRETSRSLEMMGQV